MKIVFEHQTPLPVFGYGGIERILFWHMVELVKQGHQVVLIGHPESKVSNFGIELIKNTNKDPKFFEKLIPKNADLLHLSYNYVPNISIPTLVTVHGNGKIGEKFPLNSIFVSKKHAEIHNSECFIHNGIDFSEYPFQPKKNQEWKNFLFLAKASWRVKNLKQSALACKNSKKHLHIIGGRYWWPSIYTHSLGKLGGDKKLEVIRKCDALLFPVRWHEPFGIAIIEAMSQGLPVIGSPFGSLPELITQDSGFIAKNFDEFCSAVLEKPFNFDPIKIRAYVEEKFSIQLYTKKYLEIYDNILSGKTLNAMEPEYKLEKRAEDLLQF